jgi:hypothetical protein
MPAVGASVLWLLGFLLVLASALAKFGESDNGIFLTLAMSLVYGVAATLVMYKVLPLRMSDEPRHDPFSNG